MMSVTTRQALTHSSKIALRQFTTASSVATGTKLYGWGHGLSPFIKENPSEEESLPVLTPKAIDLCKLAFGAHGFSEEFLEPKLTKIASGTHHSLIAFESDVLGNRIAAVGLNTSGQLGIGSTKKMLGSGLVMNIPSEGVINSLACGREHSLVAVDFGDKSEVFSFGSSMYGQIGIGKSKHDYDDGTLVCLRTPKRVPKFLSKQDKVKQVVSGMDHTVILTEQNHLYSMGWGADGQLGLGEESTSDHSTPSRIMKLDGESLKKISASTDFTIALNEQGKMFTWGNSEYGQCMLGSKIDRVLEPMAVSVDDQVVDIAAGGSFALYLTDAGKVYVTGYGGLGLGEGNIETLKPSLVEQLPVIKKIFATTHYCTAISDSGELFVWGLNSLDGRLGTGNTEHLFVPKKIEFPKNVCVEDVSLGVSHAFAICQE
ncbi:hypothetical protein K7432_001488 [Basidiobolus ranarum]|uniref:RCC1-like domain-containing protein n=1 Tax=Basidiobolus ranarum TaxID=34480 RepID=A0ABR2X326_9FUNG